MADNGQPWQLLCRWGDEQLQHLLLEAFIHKVVGRIRPSFQDGGVADTGAATKEQAVYMVRKGDTLWGIAKRYGVALTALIAANPQIKNPNLIYPGDRVNIP